MWSCEMCKHYKPLTPKGYVGKCKHNNDTVSYIQVACGNYVKREAEAENVSKCGCDGQKRNVIAKQDTFSIARAKLYNVQV